MIKEENQEVSHQEQIYEAAYGNVRFDQQVYENILPICHVQSKPAYGSHLPEGEAKFELQAEVNLFGCSSIYFFYDPVAISMESYFLEDFNLAIFGIN